ncbi:MAG: tetratricopeptide repeat protein [Planctomycetota bacterium]
MNSSTNRYRRFRNPRTAGALACVALACLTVTGCSGFGGGDDIPSTSGGTVADARELARRGDTAFKDGDNDLAETLYKRSLDILPDQPGTLNNLGNVLVARGMYLDAQEVFKRAIQLDPNRPESFGNLGRLWLEAKWPREAVKHFDEALKIDTRYLPALRGKATANHLLSAVSEDYLSELRRAILIEADPAWRAFFDRERVRVQQALQLDT